MGGGSLKNSIFEGGGVNRLKRGTWIVRRFKSGLGKRMGYVFEEVGVKG